jgi:hypothetical protein
LSQLVRRDQRRELSIGRARLGGEPGEQLMGGGVLPVQVQAGPVTGEHTGGRSPVPGGLGVPDRLHGETVPGEPVGRCLVQRGNLGRCGAA